MRLCFCDPVGLPVSDAKAFSFVGGGKNDSTLRQVPDNQEVYIDKDGFTSIIFDITERVGGPGSGPEIDGRSLTTHLEELVGEDIETVKVWNTTATQFSRLECVLFSLSLSLSLSLCILDTYLPFLYR